MPEDNGHAGQGAVVLDIGGDVGALVIAMPARLAGVEIEIRPVSIEHSNRQADEHDVVDALSHVAVLARRAGGRTMHSAVFAQLHCGRYEPYERPAGPVMLRTVVTGGEVTQAAWPA